MDKHKSELPVWSRWARKMSDWKQQKVASFKCWVYGHEWICSDNTAMEIDWQTAVCVRCGKEDHNGPLYTPRDYPELFNDD